MFDTESLIRYGGLLIVCIIVYGSTGLFFCFFLPSGAVLFTAGVFVASGGMQHDIFTVNSLLVLSSVTGSLTGYGIGLHAGRLLSNKKDSRFFRRKHLIAAEVFYNKHGGWALMAGYFLPLIRTFAPVVAGMIRLDFKKYFLFAFIGSVIWISSFVLSGYFIGRMPFLKPWLTYIVIGFIIIVTIPLLTRIVKELGRPQRNKDDSP